MKTEESVKNLNKVIKIDEARIKNHLGEMVRSTVEETLNNMLNAEADQLCNAQRYEPPDGRNEWTLRLLADKLLELRVVDSISHTTVNRTLKKTNLSHG